MKFFIAKVTKQRDNGKGQDAVGRWVAESGVTDQIHRAMIFGSVEAIKTRLPRFWEYEVWAFENPKETFLIDKQ